MKQELFVAVDIGCIECCEDSAVLGVFKSKDHALAVCKEHELRQIENWHGQHSFEVFMVTGIDIVQRVEY